MQHVEFAPGRHALAFGAQKLNLHVAGREFEPKAAEPTPGSADLCFLVDELDAAGLDVVEGPVERTGVDRHDPLRVRARPRRQPGRALRAVVSCAFDFEHYRELLDAARAGGYRFAGFDREPEAGDLILRHDVDLSLDAAVRMAEVEAKAGAWSTWFLMTRSVFYNLASHEGERAVARLRELGGRIAHHAVWPDVDLDSLASCRSSPGTTRIPST